MKVHVSGIRMERGAVGPSADRAALGRGEVVVDGVRHPFLIAPDGRARIGADVPVEARMRVLHAIYRRAISATMSWRSGGPFVRRARSRIVESAIAAEAELQKVQEMQDADAA
jgi:hypothetical protein